MSILASGSQCSAKIVPLDLGAQGVQSKECLAAREIEQGRFLRRDDT